MKELFEELKALIEAGKKEEAVAKVDEISRKIEDERPTIGGGGVRPPFEKDHD